MKRHEVIEHLCETVSLIYHSIGDTESRLTGSATSVAGGMGLLRVSAMPGRHCAISGMRRWPNSRRTGSVSRMRSIRKQETSSVTVGGRSRNRRLDKEGVADKPTKQ